MEKIFTHASDIPDTSEQPSRSPFLIGWGFSIVSCPMHLCLIVVAYLLWTFQTKKGWIIGVRYHYLYSGVTLFSCSFSDNFVCTWQVRYHPTLAYVKNEMAASFETFFGFTDFIENLYGSPLRDNSNFSYYTKTTVFFHIKLLLFNLTP